MSTPAKCLPVSTSIIQRSPALLMHDQSGIALGATWDPALLEEVGSKILAEEAKLRAVSSINGPVCNIPRVSLFFDIWPDSDVSKQSPLGGRVSQSSESVGFYSPDIDFQKLCRRSLSISHDGCRVCKWCSKRRYRDCP